MSKLKLKKLEVKDTYGKFEVSPFEPGFGHTFATPLRRVLLSSIKGTAVSKIKIKGVDHEFTTLKGMKEDILKLVLNLQNVLFRLDGTESEKFVIKVKGIKDVKASDIKVPGNVEILNPDFVLASLTDKSAELEVEGTVETGYGFELQDDEIRNSEPGTIPLPKSFSPVLKVSANVESTRVGQKTNYEKILLEIWTNGTVSPEEALKQSVNRLLEGVMELNAVINHADS